MELLTHSALKGSEHVKTRYTQSTKLALKMVATVDDFEGIQERKQSRSHKDEVLKTEVLPVRRTRSRQTGSLSSLKYFREFIPE